MIEREEGGALAEGGKKNERENEMEEGEGEQNRCYQKGGGIYHPARSEKETGSTSNERSGRKRGSTTTHGCGGRKRGALYTRNFTFFVHTQTHTGADG